ncbi:MAG: transposase [Lachnospiraceae bacterium]|nr:transposase [Lachnospiraceae bacterium]
MKQNAPKKQKQYYSGKKKKHTIKVQIIADSETKDILNIAFTKGRTHDFKLFKDTVPVFNPFDDGVTSSNFSLAISFNLPSTYNPEMSRFLSIVVTQTLGSFSFSTLHSLSIFFPPFMVVLLFEFPSIFNVYPAEPLVYSLFI